MADRARFPIRFSGANRAMAVLGIARRTSYVELTSSELVVRLGWAFRTGAARSSVRAAEHDHAPVWGWGAHGWRGVWLVNGSSSGIVRIDLDPPARGRVLMFPIRPRAVRVSVEDPDALIAALTAA